MRLTPASWSADSLANFSRSNFSQKSLYNLLQSIFVWAIAWPGAKTKGARKLKASTTDPKRFIRFSYCFRRGISRSPSASTDTDGKGRSFKAERSAGHKIVVRKHHALQQEFPEGPGISSQSGHIAGQAHPLARLWGYSGQAPRSWSAAS